MSTKVRFLICSIYASVLFPSSILASSEAGHSNDITHMMTYLVFQLGIIIFAAKLGGVLFQKMKMPSVLGELVAGIFIGPYMLGGISLPSFPHGVFPVSEITALPVTPELYGIATVASIILLFAAGLETDFQMFLKFSLAGSILGIGGVVVSFIVGDLTAVYFLKTNFMSSQALFLGVMSTATSVGITARILSEKRKMDSPEGVSIMAGAVIDDILGIIILAVVLGISTAKMKGASAGVDWASIGSVAAKAVGVWLVFTIIGLIFAYRISNFLKVFKSVSSFSVMSLGLAFLLAGVFEKAGLALIVGAYVMGLSLSRTDLSFVIHDKLHTIQLLFVPIFFTVMGMLVNPMKLASKEVIVFGLVYTIGAILAKIIGCGLPAMFLNFNKTGALRIGLGMVPRGEVALIIAGIGLSYGVLNDQAFGVSIMMTLLTTVVAPPLLSKSLSEKNGTRKEVKKEEKVSTTYAFPSPSLTHMIESEIIESFHKEGFFINVIEFKSRIYHIKKDQIDITFEVSPYIIEFKTESQDIPFIKNVMYETLLKFNSAISELTSILESIDMRKEIVAKGRTNKNQIKKILRPENIIMDLESENKKDIIEEMVVLLQNNGDVVDTRAIVSVVMEREQAMSTGLSDGIAIPHAKSDVIDDIKLAVAFKSDGVNFESIDGQPTRIIFLIISPENESTSHLQMVSNITSIFCDEKNRNAILECKSPQEVYEFLAD